MFDGILIVTAVLVCQQPCVSMPAFDNSGREFFIAYGENANRTTVPMDIFLATEKTGVVRTTIEAPLSENIFPSKSFDVTSGSTIQVDIPKEMRVTGSQIQGKGIHIKANDSIVVYGVNKESASTDAFLALPVTAIGNEYYTVSYYQGRHGTQFQVVGTVNNTVVTIELAPFGNISVLFGGATYSSGQSFDVTIHKYQVLQIQSRDDLTGTHIISDKPIAVFSGNLFTIVLFRSGDHLVEQLAPVDNWGKTFATVPIPGRMPTTGDYFIIVASNITRISITNSSGTNTMSLEKGRHYMYGQRSDEYVYVESEEPIMLVQISKSQRNVSHQTDPAMILIAPIDQYKSYYIFAPPTRNPPYKNFLSIIIEKSKIGTLTFDGNILSTIRESTGDWHDFPGDNNLAGISFMLPDNDSHVLQSSDGTKFFTTMYGSAHMESYGMPGGFSTNVINERNCVIRPNANGHRNDGRDNDCDGKTDEDSCVGAGVGRDDDGDGLVDEDCTDEWEPNWKIDQECLEISTSLCEKMSDHLRRALIDYEGCMKHQRNRFWSFNEGECPPPCMVISFSKKCFVLDNTTAINSINMIAWKSLEVMINRTVNNNGDCPTPFALKKIDAVTSEIQDWLNLFCTCVKCKLRKLFEDGRCLNMEKLKEIVKECIDAAKGICSQNVLPSDLFLDAYPRFLESHFNFECCLAKQCASEIGRK